ncbi:hypothetical protein BKA93DRAFT_159065 [Sparassis latifolia]
MDCCTSARAAVLSSTAQDRLWHEGSPLRRVLRQETVFCAVAQTVSLAIFNRATALYRMSHPADHRPTAVLMLSLRALLPPTSSDLGGGNGCFPTDHRSWAVSLDHCAESFARYPVLQGARRSIFFESAATEGGPFHLVPVWETCFVPSQTLPTWRYPVTHYCPYHPVKCARFSMDASTGSCYRELLGFFWGGQETAHCLTDYPLWTVSLDCHVGAAAGRKECAVLSAANHDGTQLSIFMQLSPMSCQARCKTFCELYLRTLLLTEDRRSAGVCRNLNLMQDVIISA